MNANRNTVISKSITYAKAVAGFVCRTSHAPGGPAAVMIEPTNVCNLKCPLCAAGSHSLKRPIGRMSLQDFERIIDGLPPSVKELYLWGQCEPFMAPEFLKMVGYASSRGFRTIVSTNGHFLDNPEEIILSNLYKLIVSLDGVDAQTYASYRVGGDFNRVVEGLQRLAEMKKQKARGPVLELQSLVTRENQSGIPAFRTLAETLGVDRVVFKTMQVISLKDDSSYLPENKNHTRYHITSDGALETDRYWYLKNRCLRLYYSFQIDWQGNVLPCCFDKDSEYILGNVFRDPVKQIWNAEEYRNFRNMVNTRGRILDMCKNCTEGLKRMTIR